MNAHNLTHRKSIRRCLVAEDNDFDWMQINKHFEGMEESIECFRAKSMEEGLFMAIQTDFDVFLLDFNINDGDAFEMLRDVKDLTDLNDETPVILMSSELDESFTADPAVAKIEDFIPKDKMSFERLKAALQHSLKDVPILADYEDH